MTVFEIGTAVLGVAVLAFVVVAVHRANGKVTAAVRGKIRTMRDAFGGLWDEQPDGTFMLRDNESSIYRGVPLDLLNSIWGPVTDITMEVAR